MLLGKFCDRNILQIRRHSRLQLIGKFVLVSPTNIALFADIGKKLQNLPRGILGVHLLDDAFEEAVLVKDKRPAEGA